MPTSKFNNINKFCTFIGFFQISVFKLGSVASFVSVYSDTILNYFVIIYRDNILRKYIRCVFDDYVLSFVANGETRDRQK